MTPRDDRAPAPPARGRRRCALAAALVAALAGCGPRTEPRGVLLVSIDSLRADHLSCYGYKSRTAPQTATTPVIDRMLAARGLRFERAYSTTSWTLPAHMALLSGQPNELHGVRGPGDRLHPSRPWLAETLRDAGWRTAGFFCGPNLDPWWGFDRGFEVYRDCSPHAVEDPALFDPRTEQQFEATVAMHERSHEGVTGPAAVASFREWLGGVGDDERFFAFVHLWDVHYDYEAPPEHDLFFPGYRGRIDGKGFTDLELKDPRTEKGAADLARLISLYDAEIHFTDANVGRILEVLDGRRRLDDTLVVLLSDHGEEFLEHSALGHKHSLFEETVRVPLILRLPGAVPQGETSAEIASITDVVPTILELTGVPVPPGVWGTSLVRTFSGGRMPERVLPLELSFKPAPYVWRASLDGWVKVNDIPMTEKPTAENLVVFDLAKDPGEEHPDFVPKGDPDGRGKKAYRTWYELDQRAAELPSLSGETPDFINAGLNGLGYTSAGPVHDVSVPPVEPDPPSGGGR